LVIFKDEKELQDITLLPSKVQKELKDITLVPSKDHAIINEERTRF
jgi:hypothetical protein